MIRGRGLLAMDLITTRPGIDVGRVAVAIRVVVVGRTLAKPPRLASRYPGTRLIKAKVLVNSLKDKTLE
jgi:hypothetical protein